MNVIQFCIFSVFALLISGVSIATENKPTVAVTELAYTVNVAEYFEVSKNKSQSSINANDHVVVSTQNAENQSIGGSYKRIEQNELTGFTNDIKNKLIRANQFKVIQPKKFDRGIPSPTKSEQVLDQLNSGKIYSTPKQPEVEDIVDRIKKGEFNGAEFVLFGTLTSVNFRDEVSMLQGTTNATLKVSLDLSATFSLINTKTYEITSSFSATGASNEVRILSHRGDVVAPNRAKLIREASLSLANSVYSQLNQEPVDINAVGNTSSIEKANKQQSNAVTRIR